MLQLKEIKKDYKAGDTIVPALKGITLNFRKNEFVAILGPSGCGKTTLLNIIGGLDRYTTGDLLINSVSTKLYKDKDWDTYRNHEIGFVFQSYNLIPHLTVLGNVELALTLSGMAKAERRKLAKEALQRVGLEDQMNKKPNQLSGGQMQRVAIARAIVNHPHIILADEPTGALDTETSVQVMEILKEISEDCLVIMVTHNPALADQYATRIVRLLDGEMISDSDSYQPTEEELLLDQENNIHTSEGSSEQKENKGEIVEEIHRNQNKNDHEKKRIKKKDSKMSFFTALTLSFKNLLTKKGRTFLISFAGSIGIIGISLVLSISNGFSRYIDKLQNDMLSGYPVTVSRFAADYDAIENIGMGMKPDEGRFPDDENLYIYDPTGVMSKAVHLNLIDQAYVDYIQDFYEEDLQRNEEDRLTNSIQYSYASGSMNIMTHYKDNYSFVAQSTSSTGDSMTEMMAMFMGSSTNVFQEALDNEDFIKRQYDVISGHYPQNQNEVAIVVDQKNRMSVSTLEALGIPYTDANGQNLSSIAFDDLLYQDENHPGVEFKVIRNQDYYLYQEEPQLKPGDETDTGEETKPGDGIETHTDTKTPNPYPYFLPAKYDENVKNSLSSYYQSITYPEGIDMNLHIVGVLRLSEDAPLDLFNSGILYHPDLTKTFIADAKLSPIAALQNQDSEFMYGDYRDIYNSLPKEMKKMVSEVMNGNEYKLPISVMKIVFGKYVNSEGYDNEELLTRYIVESAKQTIGSSDVPSSIYIYPKSFAAKEKINAYLDSWNLDQTHQNQKIIYTDAASVFSTTLGQMVDIISYVLIAFTAISLVVSSIMIGIITYVSVIERTKEIGVLRSLGARKRDISSVFNAETLLIGLIAGLLGVIVTYVLCVPINMLIRHLAGPTLTMNLAIFNPFHALVLLCVSMALTIISGLIPSRIAANKDPVIALRTE